MSKVVLDASAVLALLNQENGSENIAQFIDDAMISSVNLSEVIAKLTDIGVTKPDIEQILSSLNLEVIPFSEEQAWQAGILRPLTKSIGLSFGDRACLALAIYYSVPVITTDRLWGNLNLKVEIQVIR